MTHVFKRTIYSTILLLTALTISHCNQEEKETSQSKQNSGTLYQVDSKTRKRSSKAPEKVLFQEWKTSLGSKPEHIQLDAFDEDRVWFTLPGLQGVGTFDYKTGKMEEYSTHQAFFPDEMVVDSKGMVWYGEQKSGSLGKFDPFTKNFEHYYPGYTNAILNGPTIDKKGIIWITDHKNNKIVRFDPIKKKFKVLTCPTPKCWVLSLRADEKNRIWYSCTDAGRIGYIDESNHKIYEFPLPGKNCGPAWLDFDNKGRVWFTLWYCDKIACFDPETEEITEYSLPQTKHGPAAIAIRKDGGIIFSTFYSNAIVLFYPDRKEFYSYAIPTPNSGQDDGIAIDSKGVIWFTEMETNKISRFEILKKGYNVSIKEGEGTIQRVKVLPLTSRHTEKIGFYTENFPLKWDEK